MRELERTGAIVCLAGAAAASAAGVSVAVGHYSGEFDWMYTVISRLASRNHNPTGGFWLAVALLVAAGLLWPVAGFLGRQGGGHGLRGAAGLLRVGLAGALLLAVEGIFALELSRHVRKAHEALALATLAGLYGGVLGIYTARARRSPLFRIPALLVILPLCAVGASQLALYLGQRDLGWVDTAWRELGVPFWLSFAFWQWVAVVLLGCGIALLVITSERPGPSVRPDARPPELGPTGRSPGRRTPRRPRRATPGRSGPGGRRSPASHTAVRGASRA
jgi:hypothetical protein